MPGFSYHELDREDELYERDRQREVDDEAAAAHHNEQLNQQKEEIHHE